MRTLLNEALPPQCADKQMFSSPAQVRRARRTFSQPAVLSNLDDLVEVGLGGTVMATPGADAEQANAVERGLAFLKTPGASLNASEKVTPSV